MSDSGPAGSDAMKEMEKVAAAVQAVRPASMQPRIISNNPQAEIIKGNVRESSAWLQSPGLLKLLKVATARLHKMVSIKQGLPVTRVAKVRASILEGETRIYIYETDAEDLMGIPVHYSRRGFATINLISLLAPNRMTGPTGYRVCYEINFAKPSDPFYPALVLDLSAPLERKLLSRRHIARTPGPGVGAPAGAE